MAGLNLDSLTSALENTRVSPSGISFAGKSLKLDTENDGNIFKTMSNTMNLMIVFS